MKLAREWLLSLDKAEIDLALMRKKDIK